MAPQVPQVQPRLVSQKAEAASGAAKATAQLRQWVALAGMGAVPAWPVEAQVSRAVPLVCPGEGLALLEAGPAWVAGLKGATGAGAGQGPRVLVPL